MDAASGPWPAARETHEVAPLREALIRHLVRVLELDPTDARLTVDHLVRNEQAGKTSHGLVRVSYTTTSGKFGPYRHVPAPSPTRVRPGELIVDGSGHLGYAAMHKLTEAGCDEAMRHGTCVVRGAFVYPSGALGDWARLACAQGAALVLVASSPRRVAPLGGTRPVVGTNALCIGVPTAPLPFVADAATSAISHGALLVARVAGTPLPPDSAVGPDGRPTTSAAEVDPTKGRGALLPFGASYKAFAFAMGIELLACLGGGVPGEVQAGRHGVFCLFLGPQILDERLPALSAWLAACDREGTRIPGWTSGRRASGQQERGVVEVPEKTIRALRTLGVLDPAGEAGGSRA